MILEEMFNEQLLRKEFVDEPYKCSEEFLVFLIVKSIRNDKFSINIATRILRKYYGNGIKDGKKIIKNFCNKYFISTDSDEYEINEDQKRFKTILTKIDLFIQINKKNQNINLELIQGYEENICKIYRFIKKADRQNFEIHLFNLFRYIKSTKEFETNVASIISNVNSDIPNEKLGYFIDNQIILTILKDNNIMDIKQLISLSPDKISICFLYNKGLIEQFLDKRNFDIDTIINTFIETCNSNLSEIEKEIVKNRILKNECTLEEIGSKFSITRERVRQIEKKLKVKLKSLKYKEMSITIINYIFSKEKRTYLYQVELYNYIKDVITQNIIIYNCNDEKEYCYNNDYEIIIDNKICSFEGIIQNNIKQYKKFISIDDFNNSNNIQKHYIADNYKLIKDRVYILKNLNLSDVVLEEIKNHFPKGFKVNEENYEYIKRLIVDKYGDDELMPNNMHALTAIFERKFILRDKATYIAIEYAPKINDSLYKKILLYVEKNGLALFSTLFNEYKYELLLNGIDNSYYLKGCIDINLPNEYRTDRDAIYYNKNQKDAVYKTIVDKMRSYNWEFSIEKLKEDLPALRTYSYNNLISSEYQNGLIRFDCNTYIYVNKLQITNELLEFFKNELQKKIEENNLRMISIYKFYVYLRINYPQILEETKLNTGDKLYNVLEYYLKDFYFNKPLISTDESFYQSPDVLINNYVRSLDKFTVDDVKDYINKQGLRNIWSYLNFIEELSNDFVQVDFNMMISKNTINISNENLLKIKNIISLLLNQNEIDTRTFKGYSLFPNINYMWNKYLLIGIIRTYFYQDFNVETTDNTYDSTDFIIRRV